ncbi:fluoride efflux transporter CrcB [Lutibacter sp. A80]|uniref:fluoride efflux transporter CrcB n=1 Tax=Lutibacter sp. A80 TaxID=2918453 RepID=UPI001F055EC9|nr:fluoride efflux transporter CrcB [Lutibacter sp. A80]UMB60200.1 fluoride efflux transporter CrcB [Lutibacter sp. A80]
MKPVLLVFFGGGLGSVLRYLVGKWLNNVENAFPYGTFFVNIIGSLIIGVVLGYVAKMTSGSNNYALLLATGFCGGFTTFSAFVYENHLFLKNGDYLSFLTYTIGSIVLGLLAVFLGFYFSKVF